MSRNSGSSDPEAEGLPHAPCRMGDAAGTPAADEGRRLGGQGRRDPGDAERGYQPPGRTGEEGAAYMRGDSLDTLDIVNCMFP